MSILAELNGVLADLKIPVETGVFSGVPPNEYCVLTPLTDSFALFGDNMPQMEVSEVRVSLFCKGNYIKRKNQMAAALLAAGFAITGRRYVGHEEDTGYNHYAIDVAKEYGMEGQ